MKKIIIILFIMPFSVFLMACNAAVSESEQAVIPTVCPNERPMICTMDYRPVCGLKQDNSHKTYSNACGACADSKVISHVPQACPQKVLSADEVLKLFSGNTYVAVIPSRKLEMTVYVDPDGTMRGMQSGHKFTSKWAIGDKGEICVSYRDKMSCRAVIEQDGEYKKVKVNDKGEKVILVVYKSFVEGNVNNF